uniref:Ig-like domain-containing protein n=1 Tax=Coturnix japonica TaxID=93934 RepID=A0A8C2U4Y5_COTJA
MYSWYPFHSCVRTQILPLYWPSILHCISSYLVSHILTLSAGESVDLTCYQNMDMRAYMFWYQQLSRSSLKLIVSTAPWLQNSYEEGYSEAKFDVSRENKLSVMTIKNVTSKDAATYFCAVSDHTMQLVFGTGTKLTVIGKPPAVAIFSPSKQEIQQKNKATLVCLASGFYPDNLNLVWKVNGVKRTEGVGTDETSTSNGKGSSTADIRGSKLQKLVCLTVSDWESEDPGTATKQTMSEVSCRETDSAYV